MPVLRESWAFGGLAGLISALWDGHRPRNHELFGLVSEPDPMKEGWRKFELATIGLKQICRDGGVELVYAAIPTHRNHAHFKDQGNHGRLVCLLRSTRARVIGLRPHLTAGDYYERDGHFNASGNAVASEKLQEFLGLPR